jgi:hypothetical protein
MRKMRVQRIKNEADLIQKLIIVLGAVTRTSQYSFETAGFGYEAFPNVEGMHYCPYPQQAAILVQPKTGEQYFKAHTISDMGECRAIKIEAKGVRRAMIGRIQPQKLGLFIDETPDKPGTGNTIHPEVAAGCPGAPLVLS